LTPKLAQALRDVQGMPEALVFPGPGGGHIPVDQLYRVIRDTAKAAKLRKHVHPHAKAHVCVALLHAAGASTDRPEVARSLERDHD